MTTTKKKMPKSKPSKKKSRVKKNLFPKKIETKNTDLQKIDYSVATDIGTREYQEDRYIVHNLQTRPELWLFAIFDGHGGNKCSQFCKDEFIKIVESELDIKKNVKNIHVETLLKKSLNRICKNWDTLVLGKNHKDVYESSLSRENFYKNFDFDNHTKIGNDSGTTSTVVLIDTKRKRLVMGNCGDSRSVVLPNKKSSFISTTDHVVPLKLTIKNFDVNVSDGRVEADLAMASSIGDHSRELSGVISRKFDMTTVSIKDGARVVMGSDGLFDIFSNAEVFVNFETAQELIDRKKKEVEDNITVIVINVEK
jgi:serine/threonine protein phosphatase PrpC